MTYRPVGWLLFAACAVFGQSRTIEVATIRPAQFSGGTFFLALTAVATCNRPILRIVGNRVDILASSICGLIRAAYVVQEHNVVGVPKDLAGTVMLNYFAIQVQAEGEGVLTQEDARGLLRDLLSERFQLKFHRQTRELPVYALYAGKNGPKMPTTAMEDCNVSTLRAEAAARGHQTLASCDTQTMADLSESLTLSMDRPVVDRTGRSGKYLVQLEWSRNDKGNGPSIFTALQEQLGLKLDAEKAPIEVLVVDQGTRPTEN